MSFILLAFRRLSRRLSAGSSHLLLGYKTRTIDSIVYSFLVFLVLTISPDIYQMNPRFLRCVFFICKFHISYSHLWFHLAFVE